MYPTGASGTDSRGGGADEPAGSLVLPRDLHRLPRGPHRLPREVVEGTQRRRIVEATARLVAEHGYASTRVADIATLARVSRSTFYEQFKDKEQLFLACYQAGSDTHRAKVEAALHAGPEPRQQARGGIVSYLEMLEADEDFAQAFFLEAQVATPLIRERFLANLDSYADLLCVWHNAARASNPGLPTVSRTVWSAVAAGIAGLCTQHLRSKGVAGIVHALTGPSLQLVITIAGLAGADSGSLLRERTLQP